MQRDSSIRETFVLSGVSTFVRVLCGLLINKSVAVILGPAGLAMLGQVQNFMTLASHALTLGSSNAVVKTLAAPGGEAIRRSLLKLLLLVVTATSSLAAIGLLLGQDTLPSLMLSEDLEPLALALALAVSLPAVAIFTLSLAVLNGDRRMRVYFTVLTGNSIAMLVLLTLGVLTMGRIGLLYGLVGSYVITAAFCLKAGIFRVGWSVLRSESLPGSDRLRSLGRIGLMSLFAAVVGPGVTVSIRALLSQTLGNDGAGLWDGVQRISDAYLLLFTVPIAAHFLPAFSRSVKKSDQARELGKGLVLILTLVPLAALLIYVARDLLVVVLYEPKFMRISDFIHYQLIADVFKMIGWILGYFLLSQERTRAFVASNIGAGAFQVFLAVLLIPEFGIPGAIWAMGAGYALYCLSCAFVVMRYLGGRYGPIA
jgi:PST family polysaccharide transporter